MRAHGAVARLMCFAFAMAMFINAAHAQPAPDKEPEAPGIYPPQELFKDPYAFCRAEDKALVVIYLQLDKGQVDDRAQQARDYVQKMRAYINALRNRKATDVANQLDAKLSQFEQSYLDAATVEYPQAADEQLELAEAAKVVNCEPAELVLRRPVIEAVNPPEIPPRLCSAAEKAGLLARADAAIAAAQRNVEIAGDYWQLVGELRPPNGIGNDFIGVGRDFKRIPGVDKAAALAERDRIRKVLDEEKRVAYQIWRKTVDDVVAAEKVRAAIAAMQPVDCGPLAAQATTGRPVPPPDARPHFTVPERPFLPSVVFALVPTLCSDVERYAFIASKIDPRYAVAIDNVKRANAHLAALAALSARATREGASFDEQAAINKETREYQVVAKAKFDEATDLAHFRAEVMVRPLDPCTQPVAPVEPKPVRKVPGGGIGKPCPPPVNKRGRAPIKVGSNAKVGSGARATKKAIGMLGGMVGGMLGGGGGGGGSGGPQVAQCRIKDSEKTVFTDPGSGISLRVGAKHTGNTLVVFADVLKSPDSGTFQGGWIEKPDGNLMAPKKADICELWGEWSLTVSWTQTTYVDGVKTSESSGGYSDGGAFSLPGMISNDDAPAGLWKQLGFSNASHGAREVALQYPMPAGGLTDNPVRMLIHVTRPSGNPVMTQPFDLLLNEGPGGGIAITRAPDEPLIDLNPGVARDPCIDPPAAPMSPADQMLNRSLGANARDPDAAAAALLKRYPEEADRDRREGQGLPYSGATPPAKVEPAPPASPSGSRDPS